MNCSDYSSVWVCRKCGSFLSFGYNDVSYGGVLMGANAAAGHTVSGPSGEYCRVCRAVKEEEDERARKGLESGQREIRPLHDFITF